MPMRPLTSVGDVHSFILRVRLDPSSRSRIEPRARFELEEIGKGLRFQHATFESVVERLSERVSAIIRESDPR